MRAMFDLNVFVDIAESREGFCEISREAFELSLACGVEVFFPLHGFTTLHYLLARARKGSQTKAHIAWLCERVSCAHTGIEVIKAACVSAVEDFEDAVIDETALSAHCDFIVTRDTRHFNASRVKAVSPADFVKLLRRRTMSR